MDHTIPQWLDAAVKAAGITTTYNAEEWDAMARVRTLTATDFDDAANDPSAAPH